MGAARSRPGPWRAGGASPKRGCPASPARWQGSPAPSGPARRCRSPSSTSSSMWRGRCAGPTSCSSARWPRASCSRATRGRSTPWCRSMSRAGRPRGGPRIFRRPPSSFAIRPCPCAHSPCRSRRACRTTPPQPLGRPHPALLRLRVRELGAPGRPLPRARRARYASSAVGVDGALHRLTTGLGRAAHSADRGQRSPARRGRRARRGGRAGGATPARARGEGGHRVGGRAAPARGDRGGGLAPGDEHLLPADALGARSSLGCASTRPSGGRGSSAR